jgi:hypothetical protein
VGLVLLLLGQEHLILFVLLRSTLKPRKYLLLLVRAPVSPVVFRRW